MPLLLRSDGGPDALAGRTVGMHHERYAFPALRPGDPAQHPFTVWWAVLYALSMLARYQPREWAGLVSVDRSGDAVALEHLLEESLLVLPELIHRTVVEAAG